MQFVNLVVPQQLYDKLKLDENKTLVISSLQGSNSLKKVTDSNSSRVLCHSSKPELTAPTINNDIGDVANDSLCNNARPSRRSYPKIGKILYPRRCDICNKFYRVKSSYFKHRRKCRSNQERQNKLRWLRKIKFGKKKTKGPESVCATSMDVPTGELPSASSDASLLTVISNLRGSNSSKKETDSNSSRVLCHSAKPVSKAPTMNNDTGDVVVNESFCNDARPSVPRDPKTGKILYPRLCYICNESYPLKSAYFVHWQKCRSNLKRQNKLRWLKKTKFCNKRKKDPESVCAPTMDVTTGELPSASSDAPVLTVPEIHNAVDETPISENQKGAMCVNASNNGIVMDVPTAELPSTSCDAPMLTVPEIHNKSVDTTLIENQKHAMYVNVNDCVSFLLFDGETVEGETNQSFLEKHDTPQGIHVNFEHKKAKSLHHCANCGRGFINDFLYNRHLNRCNYLQTVWLPYEKQKKSSVNNNDTVHSSDEDDKPSEWIPLVTDYPSSKSQTYFVVKKPPT